MGGGGGGGGGGGRKHARCSRPNRRLFQVIPRVTFRVGAGIHLFHKPITATVPLFSYYNEATSDPHQQELHSCDDKSWRHSQA